MSIELAFTTVSNGNKGVPSLRSGHHALLSFQLKAA